MIVALLNHKGGVGKTTLALHLAGEWAHQGRRVTLIDADPQGSALDWSEQRLREGDLVFFNTMGVGVSHVGLVVDAKGPRFMHASSSRGVVRDDLAKRYYKTRYLGARRVVP